MKILEHIDKSWHPCIMSEIYKEPLQTLNTKILPNISYQPKSEHIFRAFQMPLRDVRLVILGQDPYPTPGNAIGYSFLNAEKTPKSLQIITKEILTSDYKHVSSTIDENNNTHVAVNPMNWVNQGVLMLNSALTVETGTAGSHLKYWKDFTSSIISYISKHQPCIWLFWGKKAQTFIPRINTMFHVKGYDRYSIEELPMSDDFNYVLTAPHPAAELYNNGNGGYYGCDHFYIVNRILAKKSQPEIIW